jgi:hypothetical protein
MEEPSNTATNASSHPSPSIPKAGAFIGATSPGKLSSPVGGQVGDPPAKSGVVDVGASVVVAPGSDFDVGAVVVGDSVGEGVGPGVGVAVGEGEGDIVVGVAVGEGVGASVR